MFELFYIISSIAPMPYKAGRCPNSDDSFFLSEFVPIVHRVSDTVQLGEKIAKLHRINQSPTGKFGFSTTPYDGSQPSRPEKGLNYKVTYQCVCRT
jgi:fructosamine-3-kinase